jgi:hypothetical protein
MSRAKRIAGITVVGAAVGLVAYVAVGSTAGAACLVATGVAIGELLVLRLEDRSEIPLSYAVFIVLASSFSLAQYAVAVVIAEIAAMMLRDGDRNASTRLTLLGERLAVAGATFAAYTITNASLGHDTTVTALLTALAAAALAQVVVDLSLRAVLQLRSTFSARGRLAWLAVASSGMLMAVGYLGVQGRGGIGIWGPLLFSTPLLAAWYAFERLDSATRSYRQTIEALSMAPEFGRIVPEGHSARVAQLSVALGEYFGFSPSELEDLELAALLHRLGQVTLDEPRDSMAGASRSDVLTVTSAMLREIRPLAAAGDIVAGDAQQPRRRRAGQILRVASEYDYLVSSDSMPPEKALECLRLSHRFVVDDESVLSALELLVTATTAVSS